MSAPAPLVNADAAPPAPGGTPPAVWAVVLAGGSGSRLQAVVADKALARFGGRTVVGHSVAALVGGLPALAGLVVVFRDETQLAALGPAVAGALAGRPLPLRWVRGGAERRDSVARALAALPPAEPGQATVLIHDGARCLLEPATATALAALAQRHGAAIAARPVTDTLKRVGEAAAAAAGTPVALTDVDRRTLWAMETPQAFDLHLLRRGYAAAQAGQLATTDDVACVELLGHPVALFAQASPNPKLTTPADLPYFQFLLEQRA